MLNNYLMEQIPDVESGVSWQSGTSEAEEYGFLGIEHHLVGNEAAVL